MSRIEKALKSAKESHEKSEIAKFAPGKNVQADQVPTPLPSGTAVEATRVFSELNDAATQHILDPEILLENRITTDEQDLSVRSAYKMLRTRLLRRLRANRWNSMAISSARSSAGKTLTAINTSISIAHELNQHVILVDLDLRRPSIAKYLGLEPSHDLVDHLVDGVPIEDVVVKTGIDRLLVIPTTSAREDSSELLSGPAMHSLASRLASDSEGAIVIYDLPPMLDADDMLAFSSNFECLLFVVAECETQREDLQQVENVIEDMNIIGLVLNKSNDTAPAYY